MKTKKILATSSFITLVLAGFLKGVDFLEINESMMMIDITGYALNLVCCLFFIYFVYTNNKSFSVGFSILTLCIQGYTYYKIYDVYYEKMVLELGFYIFILGTILLIAATIYNLIDKEESNNVAPIPMDNKFVNETKENITDQQIKLYFGQYIMGFKNMKSLSTCAFYYDQNKKELKIEVLNQNNEKIGKIIKSNVIKNTLANPRLVTSNEQLLSEDHRSERILLGTALNSSLGLAMGLSNHFDEPAIKTKTRIDKIIEFRVTFISDENEEKDLLIETEEDVSVLVDNIKNDIK